MSWLLPTAEEWSALQLSMRVALWCVGMTLLPGTAIAWILARKTFPGKSIVDAVVHLPLVLPPVVTGYLLLMVLGSNRPVGRWLSEALGVQVAFTWKGAAVASAVIGFPLFVRAARLSIEAVDRRLEDAAATLGASPWRILWTTTLPLAWSGLLTGAILSFARSLGEFGATIVFAGNIEGETRTLPLAIYSALQLPGGDAAAARLVVISIVLSLAALLASEALARRVRRRLEEDRTP